MLKIYLFAAATCLLASAPVEASAITNVTRYFIDDFPQYTITEDGIDMGRVSGDPVRVLGSYVATADTSPFTGFTFTIDPSLMPGASVGSSATLCLDGVWDISNPMFTIAPTCSSAQTLNIGLHWNAAAVYDPVTRRYSIDFSGTTSGALSFAPVMTVGVLTRVSSSQVENAVEVYWNQLRADGVPGPYYGPGWVSATQSFTTIPEPATTALLLIGLGVVAVRRRRRHPSRVEERR